jgi:phosphate transport system substrate-binding protein
MAYTRGRCTNLDYCSIAAARRDVEVRVGDDFVCPESGKPLKAPQTASRQGPNFILPAIIGGGVLVLVAGGIFVGMRLSGGGAPPSAPTMARAQTPAPATTPGVAAAPVTAAANAENVLVRLAGSATLARTVAPQLASAYLTDIGDTDIKIAPGATANEVRVAGLRGDRRETILIEGSGEDAAFKALGGHETEIVIASRRISAGEHDALAALGDMTAPTAEHLLGLGAVAVVVNAANTLPGLRRDQIAGVFTGSVTDWSALGSSASPVDVYGVNAGTEINTIFSGLALGGNALAPTVKRFADSAAVAQAVAADPRGIGFVDVADIGQTRAMPVADTGATPVSPTDRTAVAHEDYPFTYRVYLYTAPGGSGGIAQRFVQYALSPAGQAVIEQQGLASQTTKAAAQAAPPAPVTAAGSYKQFVAGARKIAITFHFEPNSTILDQKSQRDIDRVKNYMLSNHYSQEQLILVGFADNQGDPAANLAVSKKRVDAVAALFVADGVKPGKVAGFGSELEIADNATEEGREKNRRVEVYIKQ